MHFLSAIAHILNKREFCFPNGVETFQGNMSHFRLFEDVNPRILREKSVLVSG